MPHLQLARGLRVVRRGRHHLQVGLLDTRRVVLPRTAAVTDLLDDLLAGRPVADELPPAGRAALERLQRAGCVAPVVDPPTLAVHVRGALPGVEHEPLLAGWGVVTGGFGSPVLLLGAGEVAREETDPLLRGGLPHLVVRLLDGAAVLGPFVVPGETACLRCLDAHRAGDDPDHVAVVERYLHAASRVRPDGRPDADPTLAVLALAWAVRDLRAVAAGEVPSTWSRTWQLGPDAAQVSAHPWDRHPLCGCSWAGSWTPRARHAGTMGA